MKRGILLFILFVGGLFAASAQDIHFSQYNAAPLLLNPALTGVNGCDYRFAVNYRNQWTGLAPYQTFAASYDQALGKKTTYSNFAGVGITAFTDRAGDVSFATNAVNLNLAYTILLSSKGNQFLSGGIYGGFRQRSVDVSKMTFDSQYGPTGYDPNRPTGEDITRPRYMNADVGAGVIYNTNPSKLTNLYFGYAIAHLNQPNQSFFSSEDEKLYIKNTLHGGGHFGFSKQFFIMPSFMFLFQGPYQEYNFGSLLKFKKSVLPTDKTAFYVGAWYRWADALIVTSRVDFGGFNVGLSYDINVSSLSKATRGNGGPELSLIYTGCVKRKNLVTYCPML